MSRDVKMPQDFPLWLLSLRPQDRLLQFCSTLAILATFTCCQDPPQPSSVDKPPEVAKDKDLSGRWWERLYDIVWQFLADCFGDLWGCFGYIKIHGGSWRLIDVNCYIL